MTNLRYLTILLFIVYFIEVLIAMLSLHLHKYDKCKQLVYLLKHILDACFFCY